MDETKRIRQVRAVLQRAVERQARQQQKDTEPAQPKRWRINVTDPDSRLMPTRRGWVQGYNVHVAVTADQLIVATQVSQGTNDKDEFVPMMNASVAAAERCAQASGEPTTIETLLADAGYISPTNLTAPGPDRLIALGPGHKQHKDAAASPAHGAPPAGAGPREAMGHRLRTEQGAALYKRRGATVEPAIGNLKKIIDRLSRRGHSAAAGEINLAAAAFNLTKVHRMTLATG